jgi:hypothetical protein
MLMVARYGVKIILTVEEQHSHLVCQLVVVKILAQSKIRAYFPSWVSHADGVQVPVRNGVIVTNVWY